jgi:hypothetical protein
MPEHGTVSRFKHHRCSCARCREAWKAYGRHVCRMKAYGQWQPWVDADASRDHIQSLRDAGLGLRRIAALADIGYATVYRIVHGAKGRKLKSIRPSTEAALLGVQVSLEAYAESATVDGTGTRRRIEALAAVGWSIPAQAARARINRTTLKRILAGFDAEAATARAVRGLFEELWDQLPPVDTKGQRISVGRTRALAARRGWVPPMGWDNIDDPQEAPSKGAEWDGVDPVAIERALAGEKVPLSRLEVAEVVRLATEQGMPAKKIAEITDLTTRTVQRRRSQCPQT